ncbi:alpha/beta hydrolase [Gemmatimonas sp.]|uniref:alpha/beta fold hydrolase n=1 Tax=Gemmatimonas sp. TaxID=1962908 RepID=UPI0033417457
MPVLSRNNVHVSGHGQQAIVFAHGFGCDQSMWRFVAPAFEATHRVVLFDYVGSGQSDMTAYDATRYSTLQGYASDVLEVCGALDLSQVIFVGHSVSAMIGMLAATRRPSRFERLVLVAPSPCYVNDPPLYRGGFERRDLEGFLALMDTNYTEWAGSLASLVVGSAEYPHVTAELTASFCASNPEIAHRFAESAFLSDHRHDVPQVPVPSLIMQCAQDHIAPEQVGRWLARHLPANTHHAMEATGHCPQLTHPEETVAVIRRYLEAPAGIPALTAAA